MIKISEVDEGSHQGARGLLYLLGDRWLAVLAFMVAGLVAIGAFWTLLPPDDSPNLGLLSQKAEHLRAAHDDYNVLLVGTSRVYRGVDPIQLQRAAEGHGCDIRAFNFGVSKLRATELRELKERVTPAMLQGYDLILMSPLSLSGIASANWGSSRIQHFADWEGYWTSLHDIWDAAIPGPKGFLKKVQFSLMLSGSYVYRQLGIGRLAIMLRGGDVRDANSPSGDLFDGDAVVDLSRHGYVALDHEPSDTFLVRGRKILEEPGPFEAMKQNGPSADAFQGKVAEKAWRRIDRGIEHFSSFGVPIALILPPMPPSRARDVALSHVGEAKGVPVLNYNQVDRYPDLFERKHWFDYYHVNQDGAEILTNLIAQDVCPLIKQS